MMMWAEKKYSTNVEPLLLIFFFIVVFSIVALRKDSPIFYFI